MSDAAPHPDETVNVIDNEPREFVRIQDGHYVLAVPSLAIEMEVERLRLERHQWHGELTILCRLPGARTYNGVLISGDFNLSSMSARQALAKGLKVPSKVLDRGVSDIDWRGLLEEFTIRVLDAERTGQPAVILRDVVRRDDDQSFNALGLTLPFAQSAVLFGDGASLKSYLALAVLIELERRGVTTLFCDWERTEHTHRRRLEELAGPAMPAIRYVRCDKPLVQELSRLRRIVRENGIRYAALDSVAFGTNGAPESAEAAMEYNRAVRQLGIGCILVAHIAKGEHGDQRPFGSVFWHNSASASWFIKRATGLPESDDVQLVAFHRKTNDDKLRPAVGLLARFDGGTLTFHRVDPTTVDDVADKLPLWQRIKAVVQAGAQTVATIARELNHDKVESIDRTIRRHQDLFAKVDGPDGVARTRLVERQRA